MLKLSRINPMVRAIGTMGAIAGLVGAVTFANLTSNTVALSPNTLASATAALKVGLTNDGTCADGTTPSVTGMTFNNLQPGIQSSAFDFCLSNTGTSDLAITTAIPTIFDSGTIPPNDITLDMTCSNGGITHGTLDQYTGGTPVGTITAGSETDCQAKVTLNSNYNGSGGTVKPFDIDFVGTQPNS